VAPPVLLAPYADVVALAPWRLRRRAVRQRTAEVLLLEHLTELLRAPVGHEELQPRPVARLAIAVVAEQPRDGAPHLGHLVRFDEDTEPLREHRVGRQASADPQVEADAAFVLHRDE